MIKKTAFVMLLALTFGLSAFGADQGVSSGLAVETGFEAFTLFITGLAKYVAIIGLAACGVWWMFGQLSRGFVILSGVVLGAGLIYGGSALFDAFGINPALF